MSGTVLGAGERAVEPALGQYLSGNLGQWAGVGRMLSRVWGNPL